MRYDLHLHTGHSGDSLIKPSKLGPLAKAKKLDGVALTDHDTVSGWKEAKKSCKEAEIFFIQGEEIKSKPAGRTVCEIIGLYLTEHVEGKKRTPLEIIDAIHSQGGVVIMPHPLDTLRKHLPADELSELAVKIDALETFNSRCMLPWDNAKAKEFAKEHSLGMTGGSDAHTTWELGNAFTFAKGNGDGELLRKHILSRKTIGEGKTSNYLYHILPTFAKIKHKLFGRPR